MNENPHHSNVDRRGFIVLGILGAGVAGWIVSRNLKASSKTSGPNPFEYEVEAFEKVDPQLICFTEIRQRHFSQHAVRKVAGLKGLYYVVAGSDIIQLDSNWNPVFTHSFPEPVKSVSFDEGKTMVVALRRSWERIHLESGERTSFSAVEDRSFFSDIVIHDGEVFLADSGMRCVQRLDWKGQLINTIGGEDKYTGQRGLILPSPCLSIAMGQDGLLRVNNPGRHRVEIHTKEGDLELYWGKASAGIDGFCGCCNPVSVAVRADGSCITAEKGLPRVKLYSPIGEFIGVVAGPETFKENLEAQKSTDRDESVHANLGVFVNDDDSVMVVDPVAQGLHQFEYVTRS